MVHLYTPESEIELLLLKSVFEGAGIRFWVRNEAFGSLAVGPQIEHYNRKSIYVPEADFEEAILLLREFRERTADRHPVPAAERYTLRDKLRMLLEFLLFGWFMPGRRPSGRPPELTLIKNDRPTPEPPAEPEPAGEPADERPPLRLV